MSTQNSPAEDGLSQLRHLLLAPEQEKIEILTEHLDNPELRAQDVSQVLPEAMALSAERGDKLGGALAPLIADAIKQDIHSFSDVLFPVMGPAIRRSISEIFRQMIQSLNQTLEHSFSLRGLKWRLEAWRTSKSFAEVVLLHSLVYRVEEVFLIHKESGLLLQHVGISTTQDSDLVSAMLTAIQDFVRDSFETTTDQTLNSIQMGDFTLWVEQGPEAIIAGAIRGNAPERLHLVFQQALENIHLQQRSELKAFEGDNAPFEHAHDELEACLQTQYQEKKKKLSFLFWFFVVGIGIALAAWIFWAVNKHQNWTDYLQQLKAEPGILVTETSRENGVYQIRGLRDPLSRSPTEILAASKVSINQVAHHFQPYQALSPEFILQRTRSMLMPPASVDLSLQNGVLKLQGSAPYVWIKTTQASARFLPGITKIDDTALEGMLDLSALDAPDGVKLTFINGVLTASGNALYAWKSTVKSKALAIPGVTQYRDADLQIIPDLAMLAVPNGVQLDTLDGSVTATGFASHSWILSARKKAPLIPGVTNYNDSGLQDLDLEALLALQTQLQQELLLFDVNIVDQTAQRNIFKGLLADIKQFVGLVEVLNKNARIQIIGHSDSSGNPQRNLALSLSRAEFIRSYLINNGINTKYLFAVGVGSSEPLVAERTEQDRRMNRSVTLKIQLQNSMGSAQ